MSVSVPIWRQQVRGLTKVCHINTVLSSGNKPGSARKQRRGSVEAIGGGSPGLLSPGGTAERSRSGRRLSVDLRTASEDGDEAARAADSKRQIRVKFTVRRSHRSGAVLNYVLKACRQLQN